jgi:XRE family transcriptional regulator, regulator of sulfur utilization
MAQARLGQAVRRLREARGLSLRAVAEQAGFSASFLSQVENEQASPSIASMERIASALGVTLGEFFQNAARKRSSAVVRPSAHVTLHSEWSKARIESLASEGSDGRLQPMLVTLEPGGSSGKRAHPALSEEFALVLEGSVVLTTREGEQVLTTGDAVTVDAGGQRRWQNVSTTPVRILIVAAPSTS